MDYILLLIGFVLLVKGADIFVEGSSAIAKHLPAGVQMITIVFGEEVNGKIVEKGTLCKMARGEMVRRMAEGNVQTPEELKLLELAHYRFAAEKSNEMTYVFLLQEEK